MPSLADWGGIVGLIAAAALVVWYIVQSRSLVKTREFNILRETVEALDSECKRLRTELQAAQAEIIVLRAENKALRGKLSEFEAQNGTD